MNSEDNPKNLAVLVKALSATRGAVTIADAQKKDMPLIYFNQAFLNLTGYTTSEIINKNCRFLQGEDTELSAVEKLRSAISEKRDVKVVLRNYKKDGTPFWNDLMMSPVFDKSGTLTHYIGLQLDVTSQMEREERERRAQELAMENASLKREAEMLARLNEVKDDFISIASHQLRTPATIVKQNLGLLTEGYLGDMPDSQSKAVHAAYESNDRLINIINELLRHARINANDNIAECSDVNITELMSAIKTSYRSNHLGRDRDMIFDFNVDVVMNVKGDGELLQSAIENLIDNAIAYSYKGSKVTVETVTKDNNVHISVKDEGVGIRTEDKEKLFKKFSRIQNGHKFNIGGTGLGLYWVKTVVDKHRGDIYMQSNVPHGTVFTVSLPLSE